MPQFRFSLRSFFLFLFVGCLIASNIFTAWENRRLRQANVKLQVELGLLVIGDPNKLHAIAVETHEELAWRWRLHVPMGKTFNFGIATEEIPISGVPELGSFVFVLPEGAMTVTAAIRRDHLDRWIFNVTTPAGGIAMPVSDEHSQWIVDSSIGSQELAGDGETEVMNPDESMVLLRRRAMADGSSRTIPPDPCDGVMVWVAEDEQVP